MDDAVVSTLEEGGIDGHHRPDSLRGQAGGEGDRMPFGDSHIEEPIGVSSLEQVGAGSIPHARGDGHDLLVHLPQLHQPLPEYLLVSGQATAPAYRGVSRVSFEGLRRVPPEGVLLGRLEPLSLLGQHVDQDGSPHLLHTGECVHQRVQIVSLDGADIPEPKLLEEHTRHEDILHALIHFIGEVLHDFAQARGHPMQQILHLSPDPVVDGIRDHAGEVLVHRPDIGSDGHLVVVEDDDEVSAGMSSVVQCLVGQSAPHGPVADDGDDREIGFIQVTGNGHPPRR